MSETKDDVFYQLLAIHANGDWTGDKKLAKLWGDRYEAATDVEAGWYRQEADWYRQNLEEIVDDGNNLIACAALTDDYVKGYMQGLQNSICDIEALLGSVRRQYEEVKHD